MKPLLKGIREILLICNFGQDVRIFQLHHLEKFPFEAKHVTDGYVIEVAVRSDEDGVPRPTIPWRR